MLDKSNKKHPFKCCCSCAKIKDILLYPSKRTTFTKEYFIPFYKITEIAHHECGLRKISIFESDNITLDKEIGSTILAWFNII
jgi:5-methylcytosine-specific restriction enzyme subunit McrC